MRESRKVLHDACVTPETAPRERPDDDLPLLAVALGLGALVLLDVGASATHIADHVSGWISGVVGFVWGMAVLGLMLTLGERASTMWRLVSVPVLTALAVAVGLRVPDRGGWPAELHEVALVAGATALAMVLVPPMLAGKRAWGRRHPTPTAAQRLGLSAEPAPGAALPLRWSTGSRTVALDDPGDRRIQVITLLRDLGSDGDRTILADAPRSPEHGPAVPIVVATGLSDDDASALVVALRRCRATVRAI